MAVVKAQNFPPIPHQFSHMRGFAARGSAGIEHPLSRLGGKEIAAEDGRLVLDSKPTLPKTLKLIKCGMRSDKNPVGSIPARLRPTAIGHQRVQETAACGAL